jgi:hypothetical protein
VGVQTCALPISSSTAPMTPLSDSPPEILHWEGRSNAIKPKSFNTISFIIIWFYILSHCSGA